MPTPILMPALSPTMEEGKLAKWLVKEGDQVKSGKVVAEIETDKATMEVEAVDEGTVGKLLIAEGTENVKVNTPIALLLAEGESAATLDAGPVPKEKPSTPLERASPPPKTAPPPSAAAGMQAAAFAQPTGFQRPPMLAPVEPDAPKAGSRMFVSPLARRLAKDGGIDLAAVKGSGPHGRIVKRDVDAALADGAKPGQAAAPDKTVAPSNAVALRSPPEAMADDKVLALYEAGSYEVLPHDGMRKIIAQRLTLAKQTIPHFYLTIECRLDELLRARERLNGSAPKEGPRAFKLSVNDFVIKGLALALQQVPAANATWTEGGMLRHKSSDIGVAVAVEGGLFTPVIRHAELKTLSEISNEMKDLAARARKRRLAPHEYQGGTTSISNLGMFGIESFDAVINPPHATILAVGAGQQKPIVANGKVEIATIMSCTLSCDHRVVDGALGAELLGAFRAFIEDPVRMLV